MAITNYYSLEGEIIGERTGVVRTDYSRDALGSVTATRTNVPAKDTYGATYRYKPYGERLAKTGTTPDPDFQWVGTAGYKETSISHSQSYVRARHHGQQEGRWTTVDPLWPREKSYIYVDGNPIDRKDYLGLCSIKGLGSFVNVNCVKNCSTGGPLSCRPNECFINAEYQLYIGITLSGCTNCSVYQFFRRDGGRWYRDRGKPPVWPNIKCPGSGCKFEDFPGFGYRGRSCLSVSYKTDFITCVCCKEGSKCYTWGYNTDIKDCARGTCTATNLALLMPLSASTKWCQDARK